MELSKSQLNEAIELLQNADGEDLQYILEKVGMSEQLLRQLVATSDDFALKNAMQQRFYEKYHRKASGGLLTDYSKISNVEVEDIFMYDAPDFVDAYISYAEYDGKPMTDEQLEELNQDGYFVYDAVHKHLYAQGGKVKERVYIDYLNKAKGFQKDRKYFDSYEEAVIWARTHFDKFDTDYIKYEYSKGGKVGFQDKANAIADSLEGKKVAPKYRKQYGAKYDRSEAEMAGKRIAGAMRKKYGI